MMPLINRIFTVDQISKSREWAGISDRMGNWGVGVKEGNATQHITRVIGGNIEPLIILSMKALIMNVYAARSGCEA